jgi:periplasmic protein TonB
MKNKISLTAIMLGIVLMISACQSAEEKDKEINASDDIVTDTLSAPGTGNTDKERVNDTASSTAFTEKAKKGKASVVMVGAHNSKAKMEADKDGVYARAEIMPSYPGGQRALEKFVEDNLQYPQEAIDNNVDGRVVISFDIDEKGRIYRPVVISQQLGYGLEEEALRVVNTMPQWKPGKIKGKNVKTKFNLPIVYQLQ